LYTFTEAEGHIVFAADVTASILIVGAGGGGGSGISGRANPEGGGGGGGGSVGVGVLAFTGGQTYTVNVGRGGQGAIAEAARIRRIASNGGNSKILGPSVNETAYGGGLGGSNLRSTVPNVGQDGGNQGSGGGGCGFNGNKRFGRAQGGLGLLFYHR